MAYSAGFNPHPKISYSNAAPTGAASEAEYVEIAVTERCDPDRVRAVLDEGLPTGLDLVDVVEVRPGTGSFADRLQASSWRIVLPGVAPADAAAAAEAFMAAETVEVQRLMKNGIRTFDARLAVVAIRAEAPGESVAGEGGTARLTEGAEGPCAILRVVVRHASVDNGTPSVRPDDVMTGLRLVAGLAPSAAPEVTRLAQGPLDADTAAVGDPLAADRDAALR
jgi:radical SAM-linked protein